MEVVGVVPFVGVVVDADTTGLDIIIVWQIWQFKGGKQYY